MMPLCKRSLICDITQIFCSKLFHVCLICSESWQVNAINRQAPTIVILPTVFRQIFSMNHHDYNVVYPNTMVHNWLITDIIKKRRRLISMPSSIRVKFAEWDGSVNGAAKNNDFEGCGWFFSFYSFTIRKRSLCRCISMEVSPLNQNLMAHILPFNCIFTTVSISLLHKIKKWGFGNKISDLGKPSKEKKDW